MDDNRYDSSGISKAYRCLTLRPFPIEEYSYKVNAPIKGEFPLTAHPVREAYLDETNLEQSYSYADYKPKRDPTQKEVNFWKGVL